MEYSLRRSVTSRVLTPAIAPRQGDDQIIAKNEYHRQATSARFTSTRRL